MALRDILKRWFFKEDIIFYKEQKRQLLFLTGLFKKEQQVFASILDKSIEGNTAIKPFSVAERLCLIESLKKMMSLIDKIEREASWL